MERVIGNEYCCAISPPAAPDFCLHVALFYRRCGAAAGQPGRAPAAALGSPPATPPPAGPLPPPLPLPPGWCRAQPATREPRMGRYAVYRLVYEGGGGGGGGEVALRDRARLGGGGGGGLGHNHHHQYHHHQYYQPPLHRLFVETGLAGPVRGLYLDVTGSPETGMRYSEMPGDDPERAAAAAGAGPPPPPGPSSAAASPALATTPCPSPSSSSSPAVSSAAAAAVAAAPRALRAKTFIGTIAAEDFDRFRDICRRNPPPPRQFDGSRRLVPWAPVRRSQDWVHESIVRSVAEGILDVGLRQQSA